MSIYVLTKYTARQSIQVKNLENFRKLEGAFAERGHCYSVDGDFFPLLIYRFQTHNTKPKNAKP